MVSLHLHSHEQSCHSTTCQILSSITKDHTCNGRRDICQGHHFPNMSGCYNDEEITGKSPHYGSQGSHPYLEVKGTQQNIKS